jgi:hypothetical protein
VSDPAQPPFAWTDELKAKAYRLYVEERQAPTTVARCLRRGSTAADVSALADAGGWYALRGSRQFFSAETIESVRKLYVEELLTGEEVAAALGGSFTAQAVRKLAARRKGWLHARSAVRKARMQAAAAARPPPCPRPTGRRPPASASADDKTVSADLRALIDEAIAAGKVTVLPPHHAAGLTLPEQAFWAAGPAAAFDWRGRR